MCFKIAVDIHVKAKRSLGGSPSLQVNVAALCIVHSQAFKFCRDLHRAEQVWEAVMVLMAYMHQPIGGGRDERNPKVQPGLKNHSALIHNARRRLPDCHPQHICGHTCPSVTPHTAIAADARSHGD